MKSLPDGHRLSDLVYYGRLEWRLHPACYAYIGAVLPLVSAFIYLYTCTLIRGFGAATALNGFIFVLFLIAGEADLAYIIGTHFSRIFKQKYGLSPSAVIATI